MRDWWEYVAPYARPEQYGHRDAGTGRIEIKPHAPRSLLRLQGECANCGRSIFPVRKRDGYGDGMYVSVTCHALRCSRTQKARDEWNSLLAYVKSGAKTLVTQGRF